MKIELYDPLLSGIVAGQIPALTRFWYTCSPPKGGDNYGYLQISRSNYFSGSQHHCISDLSPARLPGWYYDLRARVNSETDNETDNIFMIMGELMLMLTTLSIGVASFSLRL